MHPENPRTKFTRDTAVDCRPTGPLIDNAASPAGRLPGEVDPTLGTRAGEETTASQPAPLSTRLPVHQQKNIIRAHEEVHCRPVHPERQHGTITNNSSRTSLRREPDAAACGVSCHARRRQQFKRNTESPARVTGSSKLHGERHQEKLCAKQHLMYFLYKLTTEAATI